MIISGCTSAPDAQESSSPPHYTAPTAKVAAPDGGSVKRTARASAPTTNAPVSLSETASVEGTLKASIQRVSDTAVTAKGPGEVAGPGVAVTVAVTNASKTTLALDAISLTMTDSGGKPCSFVPVPDVTPLTGTLAPGASATGDYVFTIATDRRAPITIGLIYGPSTSILLFTGDVR